MERRKCEVMIAGSGWNEVELKDLAIGDLFRMFEPDGSPVVFGGKKEFFAASKPTYDENGMYSLEITTTVDELNQLRNVQ
jgi:hypothetical protein